MKENFKTGDLAWTIKDKCWIYCIDNLPRDEAYIRQPDELITNGLPVVFIKYVPKSEWRKWMWVDDDAEQIVWCLVFYNGKEWVIDEDYIKKTRHN